MQNNWDNRANKIDGALGAMIIDDQPTHSIYNTIVAEYVNNVNTTRHRLWGWQYPSTTTNSVRSKEEN